MTKDDKEFFDKALIAMASGATTNQYMNWSAYDLINAAKDLLDKRNVFLQSHNYQEPPKAEPLPGIFGNLTVDGKPLVGKPFDASPVITIPELADHVHVGAGETTHWTLRSNSQMETRSLESAEPLTERPETTSHEVPADVNICTKTCIPVRSILAVANENKGKKLTTTEIFWLVYPGGPSLIDPPTINHLRDIGIVLRRHGYRIKRSGGKDLYQL